MTPAPVRPDGRADEHARALVVALDVVTHAAGSAYVELGDTKVSCAVYGPRQHRGGDAPARVDRGALEVDVHAAPFAGKTAGRGGRCAPAVSSHVFCMKHLGAVSGSVLPCILYGQHRGDQYVTQTYRLW